MPTVKYLIKGNKNPTTIYVRFRHGKLYDFTKSTSLLVSPFDWSVKKGFVKFNKNLSLNNILSLLRQEIISSYNRSVSVDLKIDANWFSEVLERFFKTNLSVLEKIEKRNKSIKDLKDVLDLNVKKYKPYKPVVYFLVSGLDVVYVGKTISLPSRIDSHLSDVSKTFDEILYVELLEDQLNEIEQKLIRFYKPKYNIQFN